MAAYSRVYDSRHLQSDRQELGSAQEPYAWRSSMGYLYHFAKKMHTKETGSFFCLPHGVYTAAHTVVYQLPTPAAAAAAAAAAVTSQQRQQR